MELLEKIKNIACNEMKDLKYIPIGIMDGLLGTVFYKAGVPRTNPIPQEYFEAFKEAICDQFCGGCEPEFENKEAYERFENLRSEKYHFVVEDPKGGMYDKRSPYVDKTIPYLAKIKS